MPQTYTPPPSDERSKSAGNELTAVVLTYNEEAHIEACLASLTWADRLVVFDSYSTDQTVEFAKTRGAEIGRAKFQNYAQQRNAALDFLQTDWVFFVDADERGTPELGQEIRQVINHRSEAGWFVPRHNYIFGRLTLGAGWYPDYQLRLLRHGRAFYERPVHEVALVDGEIGHLETPLIHHNYRDPAHFHAKQQAYTLYDASVLYQQGVQPKGFTPFTQPVRQFWWRFYTLHGYRDGWHGLRLSLYMAYYEWRKYRHLAGLLNEGQPVGSAD